MFQLESDVFLQRPDETARRVLHRARVINTDETITVLVEPDEPAWAADQPVLVYFESKMRFARMPARVVHVAMMDGERFVRFEATGPVAPAESRQCYRVATVTQDLHADVGSERRCQLADVSAGGFSIISERTHAIGDVVPVSLEHEGRSLAGVARVQSLKTLSSSRVRAGFMGLDDTPEGKQLLDGLRQMSMDLQRLQLRRRAG